MDTHRLTERRHRAWAIGGAPYDPAAAQARVRADAAQFVARVRERGLCVCAIDTELLGHWWVEGIDWLRAVLEEADRTGLMVAPLDRALDDIRPGPAPAGLPPTSWGTPRDLSTWSGPAAQGLAWRQRAAELRALDEAPSPRALRELLALQASDWAFLISRATAGPYPLERFEGHAAAFAAALADPGLPAEVRHLCPGLGYTAPLFN
jgi:1,4-alpha-glucan branching enzyme